MNLTVAVQTAASSSQTLSPWRPKNQWFWTWGLMACLRCFQQPHLRYDQRPSPARPGPLSRRRRWVLSFTGSMSKGISHPRRWKLLRGQQGLHTNRLVKWICRNIRCILPRLLRLTLSFLSKVKTWFQNRRMKLKRHQRDSSWMTERYVINGAPNTPAPSSQVSVFHVWHHLLVYCGYVRTVACSVLLVVETYQCGQRAIYHL